MLTLVLLLPLATGMSPGDLEAAAADAADAPAAPAAVSTMLLLLPLLLLDIANPRAVCCVCICVCASVSVCVYVSPDHGGIEIDLASEFRGALRGRTKRKGSWGSAKRVKHINMRCKRAYGVICRVRF